MPVEALVIRVPPPGMSSRVCSARGSTVAGSNTTTSAAFPTSRVPRSLSPRKRATREVNAATPSSREKDCFSRTQWARK